MDKKFVMAFIENEEIEIKSFCDPMTQIKCGVTIIADAFVSFDLDLEKHKERLIAEITKAIDAFKKNL